jgi:hypothetical protein
VVFAGIRRIRSEMIVFGGGGGQALNTGGQSGKTVCSPNSWIVFERKVLQSASTSPYRPVVVWTDWPGLASQTGELARSPRERPRI